MIKRLPLLAGLLAAGAARADAPPADDKRWLVRPLFGVNQLELELNTTAIQGVTALMWRIFVAGFVGARF